MLRVPISHGEGSYFADPDTIRRLESEDRILFRYCTVRGEVTQAANPNGSMGNIAGIVNEQGNVMGMMPHPEDHIYETQHPRARRGERGESGLALFVNGVRYAAQL